jgi:hypothetical protein
MVVLGETNIFCGGTLYKKFENHCSSRMGLWSEEERGLSRDIGFVFDNTFFFSLLNKLGMKKVHITGRSISPSHSLRMLVVNLNFFLTSSWTMSTCKTYE